VEHIVKLFRMNYERPWKAAGSVSLEAAR